MSDIVERLHYLISGNLDEVTADDLEVVANEVERLREENDALRYADSQCRCAELRELASKSAEASAYWRAKYERLRRLLREAREYLTPANETDEGCSPGECPECDMLRIGLRIDAALGAADGGKA